MSVTEDVKASPANREHAKSRPAKIMGNLSMNVLARMAKATKWLRT